MLQDTSIWVMTALTVMMGAVLLYAVNTLYGMKRKIVYPLLRIRLRDGDHSVVIVTNTSSSREQLSLLYAGMW